MAEYVLVWCLRHNSPNDTLLILKDRPDWQKGRFNLPGGKIEEGESPEVAAVRELKEETGYEPLMPVRCMGKMVDGPFTIYCLKAVLDVDQPPIPREGETEIAEWLPWHKALNDPRLLPNLKVIIPIMKAGVHDFIIGDTYRGDSKDRHTIKISVPNG